MHLFNLETELHEIMQIIEGGMVDIFLGAHMKEIQLEKKKKTPPKKPLENLSNKI